MHLKKCISKEDKNKNKLIVVINKPCISSVTPLRILNNDNNTCLNVCPFNSVQIVLTHK